MAGTSKESGRNVELIVNAKEIYIASSDRKRV